jgi:hypothetical protein
MESRLEYEKCRTDLPIQMKKSAQDNFPLGSLFGTEAAAVVTAFAGGGGGGTLVFV